MSRIISRRGVLRGAAALGAGLAAGWAPVVLTRRRREHILLIVADALRGDRVGRVVNGMEVTPFINGLAEGGVCFREAYAPAPWTKTAMASILTGRTAPYHGIRYRSYTLPEIETLGSYLAGRGYRTYAVQTNPWLEGEIPDAMQGHETVRGGFQRGFGEYLYLPTAPAEGDSYIGEAYVHGDKVVKVFSKMWGKPEVDVFSYVHFMDTHQPWLLARPTEHTGRFHGGGELGRLGAQGVWERDREVVRRVLFDRVDEEPEEGDAQRIGAVIDEAAALADGYVREMCEFLDARGELAATTIIFTADHGDEIWEHGELGHGRNLYNSVLHVPLVVKRAGLGAREVGERVSNASVLPMVKEWFGEGEAEEGRIVGSLGPYMRGARRGDEMVYANFKSQGKVILPGGEAAISGEWGWHFNVEADPGERRPLAGGEEVFRELAKLEAAAARQAEADGVEQVLSTHQWQWQKDKAGWGKGKIGVDVEGLSEEKRRQLKALGYLN